MAHRRSDHRRTIRFYVDMVLPPTLRPGNIVVMDNLGSHRAYAVRCAIRAVGAKFSLLPKYSLDLIQIEKYFAKARHWPKEAA